MYESSFNFGVIVKFPCTIPMDSLFFFFSNEKPQSKIGFSQYEKFATKTVCGIPCVFPFKYKGKSYDKCTDFERGKHWCATIEDLADTKDWGDCITNCDKEKHTNSISIRGYVQQ